MPNPSQPTSKKSSDIDESLAVITSLLRERQHDFNALRQMHAEWVHFQSTLKRLVRLVDGNGRPPVTERLLILEEQSRRLALLCTELDAVKLRLIGLLLGMTLSLVAALFAATR